MSLWLNRGRIVRAVAGELEPSTERRLRGHLAGCPACRSHYDRLSAMAAALGGAAGRRRERDRLLDALGGASPAAARSYPWAPALALAAAAALVFWLRQGAERSGVTWRGPADDAPVPVRLLLHASRKGEPGMPPGPLRLVADLPGAGEGRVSVRDYLQLSYVGLAAPAYATVVGLDEGGGVHQYAPRPDAGPMRVTPTDRARGLGPSVDLGRQRPGRFRLIGVFASAPVSAEAIRAAAARARADGQPVALAGVTAVQVRGVLIVEP
jgi:hypothetical protein